MRFGSNADDALAYYQPILSLGNSQVAGRLLSHLYTLSEVSESDWRSAFDELGLSDHRHFTAKDPEGRLPWEHISFSSHQNLRRRFTKSYQRHLRNGLEIPDASPELRVP